MKTLQELSQIEREFLTVAEASEYFGCNPQKLREQAHRDQGKLGFPVSIIGNRVKIPKGAFIQFCTSREVSVKESNELQVFNSEQFGSVRVKEIGGEPWFVASDVCKALELGNPTMALDRLDADERTLISIEGASNGLPVNVVSEAGLYSLVIGSRKPEARAFKRWITHDVIPTIRKHGAYVAPAKLEEIMNDPDAWITMLTALKEERAAKELYRLQTEADKPKVLFANAVAASNTSILVGDLAKLLKQNGIEIGQNRLFDWLREHGYLMTRHGDSRNMPTQRSMELGLMEIKESSFVPSSGSPCITKTPMITGKGQLYFIRSFLEKTA